VILGALLDRVSLALRQEPHIKRADLPRMADFAKWGMAAFPPNEQEKFLTTYDQNCKSAVALGLEGSSVAIELRKMVTPDAPFEGTMTELLKTSMR
jgi:putative DNA primase/helicase